MNDYTLVFRAGEPGEPAWFWRLDDAAGFQIAASSAARLADAFDAVKLECDRLGLDTAR